MYPGDSDVAEAFQKWPLRLIVIGVGLVVFSAVLRSAWPLERGYDIPGAEIPEALNILLNTGLCIFLLGLLTYIFARIIGRRR